MCSVIQHSSMSDNFLQMLAHYLQRIFANFSGAFSGSCIRWHNFAPPPLPRIQGGPCFMATFESSRGRCSWPPLAYNLRGPFQNYFHHSTPGPPLCQRRQNDKSHIVHLHELRTPAKHPRRCFPHVNRAAAASGGGSRLASSATMAMRGENALPASGSTPIFYKIAPASSAGSWPAPNMTKSPAG